MDVLGLKVTHGNDVLALGNHGVGGSGHDNVEVAHGTLVPAVAELIALIGAQQGEISVDGLHQQVILAIDGLTAHAEGALLHQRVDAHGGQHAAQTGAGSADALSQRTLRQQVDLQRTLGVLLADLGGHADVGGDHALDLMIVDQLRDAEELLTLGAGGATHIVGDQGQILGAAGYQLLDDGAGLAAGAVLVVLLAPRFTIALARLPLPPVPTSGGPIDPIDGDVRPTIEGIGAIGAMALPSAAALERRAHTANQYLTGIVLGGSVLAGVGALLAADPLRGFDWRTTALAIIVAVVLALRGRAHSDVAQTAVLVGAGALTYTLLFAGLGLQDATWAYVGFGAILALAVVALLCGVVAPQQEVSPVVKRFGEIAEYILVGLIPPLTFWVMDIYSTVRNL